MGLMDMFGGGGSNGGFYNPAFFDQRQNQINDFSNALTAARTRYLNNYQNFNQQQFLQQLMPNIAASFAARGLQMNGGAYNAELARQAASMQGQALNTGFNAENNDLMAVDSANQNLFGQRNYQYTSSAQQQAQNDAARRGAMMSALGSLGGAGIGALAGPSLNMAGNGIASYLGSALSGANSRQVVAANPPPQSNYVMQNSSYQNPPWWNSHP